LDDAWLDRPHAKVTSCAHLHSIFFSMGHDRCGVDTELVCGRFARKRDVEQLWCGEVWTRRSTGRSPGTVSPSKVRGARRLRFEGLLPSVNRLEEMPDEQYVTYRMYRYIGLLKDCPEPWEWSYTA